MASENKDSTPSQSEARIPLRAPTQPVVAPLVSLPTSGRSRLEKARDFLLDSSRIGSLQHHYPKYRRYVQLENQAIFNSLVSLYSSLFTTQWQHFRRFMDQFPLPANLANQPVLYAARTYISHWFWDLHVSIRDSVKKISSLAFSQHFQVEVVHNSYEYDDYLVTLNALIRPTHVKLTSEDVLYIPLLIESPTFDDDIDPFNIEGFLLNDNIFHGLLAIIRDRRNLNTSNLVEDTLGRPAWLLDWFDNERAHAWFPPEGNYTQEDIMIVYILGVPCTPKLAPRDFDDWQTFPNGIRPQVIRIPDYHRVNARCFFGSVEERTIMVTQTLVPAPDIAYPAQKQKSKKSKSTATASSISSGEPSTDLAPAPVETLVHRYKIVDWLYYHNVIFRIDMHTRTGALRMIVLN